MSNVDDNVAIFEIHRRRWHGHDIEIKSCSSGIAFSSVYALHIATGSYLPAGTWRRRDIGRGPPMDASTRGLSWRTPRSRRRSRFSGSRHQWNCRREHNMPLSRFVSKQIVNVV